jgi:hypothetical protein
VHDDVYVSGGVGALLTDALGPRLTAVVPRRHSITREAWGVPHGVAPAHPHLFVWFWRVQGTVRLSNLVDVLGFGCALSHVCHRVHEVPAWQCLKTTPHLSTVGGLQTVFGQGVMRLD